MKKFQKIICLALSLILTTACLASCGLFEMINPPRPTVGAIYGTVLDGAGEAVNGAKIFYDEENYVVSDSQGKFTVEAVPIGDITLKASANGYSDAELTLTADSFDKEGSCTASITLEALLGTLKGTVSIAGVEGSALSGVAIEFDGFTAVTDENGNYEIKNVPMPGAKVVSATLKGYEVKRESLSMRSFDENGVATLDFELSEITIEGVAGLKAAHLEGLVTLPSSILTIDRTILFSLNRSPNGAVGSSKVEEHSEGLCLNSDTRNDNSEMSAYVYGKVTIDEDHRNITIYARTFFGQNGGSHADESTGNFSNSKLAELGLYLIDEEGNLVTNIGSFTRIDTESYKAITFDLSAYEGQTVVLVIGTKTGYHCCIDRMEFSADASANVEIIPGLTMADLKDLPILPENMTTVDRATLLSLDRSPNGLIGNSKVEEHGEGLCLNSDTKSKHTEMAAYIYGKLKIDENHKSITIYARVFFGQNGGGNWNQENSGDFSNSSLAELGIFLVDEDGNLVRDIGDFVRVDTESYKAITFDLSAYEGQTVVLIIGTNTGYHCCLDRIEFSSGN